MDDIFRGAPWSGIFHTEDFCLCPVDIFLYHLQFTIMIRIFLLTLMIEFKVPPSSSRASIIPFVWMQFRLNLLSSINKGDDKLYSLRWIYIFIQIRQQHWDQKIWVWLCVLSALHLYEARYPSHIKSNTSLDRSWHKLKRWKIVNQWLLSWVIIIIGAS